MRILHLNSANGWAGGEVHVFLLCQQLIKAEHTVILACRPNSEINQRFRNEKMAVFNLSLKGAGDMYSAYRLAAYCKENNIEIIHAHLGRDYWLAFAAKQLYPQIKIIFTRHLLFPLKQSFMHKIMHRSADRIIAVSKAVEKVIEEAGFVDQSKLTTIYNGIDVDKFKRASSGMLRHELGLTAAIPIIGIVGHVSEHKGQDIVIRSIPSIIKMLPDAKIVIVGDDFQQGTYIQQLKDLAYKIGVADHVIFLGPRNDIPEIMKDLDAFVLASHNEPFGLVIVEAMAAGVPVVVTRAGGALEIVEHGINGFLVPVGDIAILSEYVCKIVKDKSLSVTISKNAILRVQSLFSIEIMVEKTIEVYREVLSHK